MERAQIVELPCDTNWSLSYQIINGLHFRGLEGDLAHFGTGSSRRTIDLDLDNLTLDDFSLLPDTDPNAFPILQ